MKDRQQIERCLQVVAAYEASGQKASRWCEANAVALRDLASWCGHARRWRAWLDEAAQQAPAGSGESFVAAVLPSAAPATVRVEISSGATAVALHWPMSHVRELTAWLREVGR